MIIAFCLYWVWRAVVIDINKIFFEIKKLKEYSGLNKHEREMSDLSLDDE